MAVIPLRAPRGPVDEPRHVAPKIEIANSNQPKPGRVTIEIGDGDDITINGQGIGGGGRPRRRPAPGKFDRNLADDLGITDLQALASYVIESVEADEEDRREWEDTANQVAAWLGIKLDDPKGASSEDGTVCNAVATCMLEAAMKLWSTAYAELLPAAGPVKVERKDPVPTTVPGTPGDQGMSPPSPGQPPPAPVGIGHNGGPAIGQDDDATSSDDLADALERDLNWYLTKGDPGYYPDTSKMLFHRALVGIQFKEIYDCPILDKPVSRWVRAQDLIVKGDPAHLSESRRHTVRKKVPQGDMRRMMAKGHYRDITLAHPTARNSPTEIVVGEAHGINPTPSLPRDYDHTIYQCHCELGSGTTSTLFGPLEILDVDEKGNDPGYPLPYIVTVDVDSREVLRISRAWEKGDKDHRRERRFVKFGFIPGFSFYDFGLIHLVGNPTQAATMLERSCVDAGIFSNFPGWLMKQGPTSKEENTVWRLQPGEIRKVPIAGQEKIADAIMPVPYRPPSAEALEMAAAFESKVKSIAGVIEIPVGEGRIGNTPVGTIMSYIESTTMVPGAVHKFDHVAQSEEFEVLRDKIAKRPAILTRGNPSPARKWQVGQELKNVNLSPASDPNTPSLIHRLAKIQGRVQLAGLQQFQGVFDQIEVGKDAMEALGGEVDRFMAKPQAATPPPPDPKLAVAQIKAQSDQTIQGMKGQQASQEAQQKLQEAQLESQDRAADRQAANEREAMKTDLARQKTGADMVKEGATAAHEAQQSGLDRGHDAALQAQDHAANAQAQQQDHAQQTLTSNLQGGAGSEEPSTP